MSALERMAERMRLVTEVGMEIAAIHDLESILSIIPNRLTQTFGYYHAAVGVIDGNSIVMREAVPHSRAVGPERFRIPLDAKGMIPWVARLGQTRLSNDTRQDNVWIPGKGLEGSRSELTVPVISQNRVIGVIDAQSERLAAFDQDDVAVLQTLAGLLAVAIENARLFDENQRQRRVAEALNRISRMAGALLNAQEVAQTVIDALGALLPFEAGLIALFENDAFQIAHQVGFDDAMARWLIEESPVLYRVLRQTGPLLVADTADDSLWQKSPRHQGLRSWVGAPLRSRSEPIGVVVIASAAPQVYREPHAELLVAYANQVAGAIDNARFFEQSKRREREARALYEITRLLVTFDQAAIPASVLSQLEEALPFDVAGMLVVGNPDRLVITARRSVAESAIRKVEADIFSAVNTLSQEPINATLAQRRVTRIGEAAEGDALEQLPSRLSAPLLVGRHVAGIIELRHADPHGYNDTQRRALYIIANSTAAALENARLYEELKARATHLQQAVDELAAADRLKDELVGNLSHELRAPLTYIVSYVDLLLANEMGDLRPEQRESLEIVADKARMLTRLVSDILSLDASEADMLALALANLAELAQQAVREAAAAASEAGIRLETEFETGVSQVMADPDRIGQVFTNLLGNALKFSASGDTVTVRVMQRAHCVRVEVEDTGIGIPADKLPRVFERYYQAHRESRRRYGGAGLGLAICKQIVEAHGGKIGVRSQEGVGSLFYFELPDIHPDQAG